MRSDVKLGVLLSGGLDSSLVTALTNHNSNKKIYTFSASIVKSKFDESKNQNLIKKIFKTKHEKINFSERNLIENLKDAFIFTNTHFIIQILLLFMNYVSWLIKKS